MSETAKPARRTSERLIQDYRDVLRLEFEKRTRRNPRYSMGAFARDLELSPSRLSEVLSGKQGLSPARARIVGSKMGLKTHKLEWFCDLVTTQHARSRSAKALAAGRLARQPQGIQAEDVSQERLQKVTWYHFAIRRMTLLADFRSDVSWIAMRLQAPIGKIQLIVDELIRTGLLRVDDRGVYSIGENIGIRTKGLPKAELARYFGSILWRAFQSYKNTKRELRIHNAHYFTIGREQLDDYRALIAEFEDRVDLLTHQAKSHDELYTMMVSFFPLTASSQNLTEQKV